MKRKLLWLTAGLMVAVLIAASTQFHADLPLTVLKQKYAGGESRFVELQKMPIHYRDEGQGPPLLLLHGSSSSLHTWDDWTQQLKSDFRVLRFDLPGFGLTGPHPDHNYSVAAHSDLISAFLDERGIDSCYVAGNSLGGRIAWEYALVDTARVKKLILIDASGFKLDKPRPLAFRLAQSDLISSILRYLTPRSLVEKSLLDVYGDDSKVTEALVDRYFDMALRPGNRDSFVERARTYYPDHTADLARIDVPVLILWGEGDLWIPVEVAARFDELLPDSRVVVYENAGHVPMEELPHETAADARLFLVGE